MESEGSIPRKKDKFSDFYIEIPSSNFFTDIGILLTNSMEYCRLKSLGTG